jgi:hypothetical protein
MSINDTIRAEERRLAELVRRAQKVYGGRVEIVVMSFKDWEALPRNPYERDEEVHARRLRKVFEAGFSADSLIVAAYELNGVVGKVDGHSRTEIWKTWPESARPKSVIVVKYHCRTMDDVHQIYLHYDNQISTETAADRIRGYLKGQGTWTPRNSLLREGNWSTALNFVLTGGGKAGKDPMDQAVSVAAELMILDGLVGATKQKFPGFFFAAALMSIVLHGRDVLPFWQAYCEGEGQMAAHRMNGVQCLLEYRKASKGLVKNRGNPYVAGVGIALKGMYRWLDGEFVSKMPPTPKKGSWTEYVDAYRVLALDYKKRGKRAPLDVRPKVGGE